MEQHFTVSRTARYQQLGELSPTTTQLWLVLHGYGQLAEYFIRHFAPLHAADPAGTVIVAPEGLSRFYLSGTGGRVGASWMTRADRLAEIEDQATYLDALLGHLRAAAPAGVQLTVLDFSQGTATASRWLARGASRWRPERLILWAGDFPTDIEADNARYLLTNLPVALVSGERDEYMSADVASAQAALLRAHGAQVSQHVFAGGHTLHAGLLRQLHAAPTPFEAVSAFTTPASPWRPPLGRPGR